MGNTQVNPVPAELDVGYYQKLTGLSYNQFLKDCQELGTDYDKFDRLMETYTKITPVPYRSMFRDLFVSYISFAVPTPKAIKILYEAFKEHLKQYPNAKFVDFGAGSGVFCWLLHRAGIPKDQLLAIDLPSKEPEKTTRFNKFPEGSTEQETLSFLFAGTKTHEFCHTFWEITETPAYVANPEDLLFVGWGYGCGGVIDQYEGDGGKCLIILGELEDGATYPADEFSKHEGWKVEYFQVLGSMNTLSPDILSINTRY